MNAIVSLTKGISRGLAASYTGTVGSASIVILINGETGVMEVLQGAIPNTILQDVKNAAAKAIVEFRETGTWPSEISFMTLDY